MSNHIEMICVKCYVRDNTFIIPYFIRERCFRVMLFFSKVYVTLSYLPIILNKPFMLLLDNPKETNPFSLYKKGYITENEDLRATSVSFYEFMMVVGVLGLVITIVICGIRLALSHNSKKAEQIKDILTGKVWIALGLFSFVAVVGLIFDIINSIV